MNLTNKRIYIAGHRGMVGQALVRALESPGAGQIAGGEIIARTSDELDLRDQLATNCFFAEERPDVVLFAAAKVGGILRR